MNDEAKTTSSSQTPALLTYGDFNSPIIEFLKIYTESKVPLNYAVLLSGPWGSGKTFFVKRFMDKYKKGNIYVSLYGISSTAEIDDQIYQQLHPVLSSKGMRLAGKLFKGAIKGALKFDIDDLGDKSELSINIPNFDLRDFVNNSAGKILIFDDLERAHMDKAAVLGYINVLVEHDDMKAIIIANEDEIDGGNSDFSKIKEKLIGQTLKIFPSASDAYKEFLKLITDTWTADFLETHATDVLDIFSMSKTENIRVLKQTLWDFERLAVGLRTSDRIHTDALRTILRTVTALSIEVRTGRLDVTEIGELRGNRWMRAFQGPKAEKTKLDETQERYSGIDLDQTYISPEILTSLFNQAYVDPKILRSSLDRSPPFTTPESQTSWLVAWNAFRGTDSEYESAIKAIKSDFDARVYDEPGVILHIFGIFLQNAKIDGNKRLKTEAVKSCKKYIDDLLASNRIDPSAENALRYDLDSGYGGLGYFQYESDEFRQLKQYYEKAIAKSWKKNLPVLGAKLLLDLEKDTEIFVDNIRMNTRSSAYWNVAILHTINPNSFSKAVLALPPNFQNSVFWALQDRYNQIDATGKIAKEIPWLARVRKELNRLLPTTGRISRYRLRALISKYIDPVLDVPAQVDSDSE